MIVVFTLGCKVNKYESEFIIEKLNKMGYETSENLQWADYYIINSCAVTNEAERKSRQAISRVLKFNPNAKIFVLGCASENNRNQFQSKNVVKIYGCADKFDVLKYFKPQNDICEKTNKTNRVRKFIKIQDGCNNFCSYCLIPYLRGRSISKSFNEIIEEVSVLTQEKEIVLTGIDISDFKINGQPSLAELVENLDFFKGRIRLGSLEVGIIDETFLKKLKKCVNFCPHFHLSLQSGSDTVLKRMNRHYTTKQFEEAVNSIRKIFPNASITTDIIVGFPMESEKEFEQTYNFAKKLAFSDIHIFPYSKRKGTNALKFNNFVNGEIIKQRVKKLNDLKIYLQRQFYLENIGKSHTLLIEEIVDKIGYGYTENYIYAKIENECYLGQFVEGELHEGNVFVENKN